MTSTHPEGDPILSLDERPLPFIIMSGVFCGLLVVSAAIGSKVIAIFGLTPGASVIAFSLSFVCTDAISELYGKRRATMVVWAGLATIITAFVMFQLAIHWQAAPFWNNQESYQSVLGASLRILVAGVLSYTAAQFHDVWAFHFWRRITGPRHLWIRNNLSTAVSQLINTVIFITIVFWDTVPLLKVIISHYLVKLALAAADTPVTYGVVHLIRRRSQPITHPAVPQG